MSDLYYVRPVSNLSFFSKILEKVVLNQLLKHFDKFESIPIFQSAYRKYHSVETAICKIFNDLIVEKCNNKCTLLILLDQTAAFDTVNHCLLLDDLSHFGIDGTVLNWFKSYLHDRKFKVVTNDSVSDAQSLSFSVPQGSILGPYLYIIYSIELYYLLLGFGVSCHFYADDTQIYIAISDIETTLLQINIVLNAVKQWMESKRLKLNMDKTEIIIIGSKMKLKDFEGISSLKLFDTDIEVSKRIKNLGVFIDSSLTLDDQIKSIKKKSIGNLKNISHIRKYIDKETCLKLVHNLVLSNIDFCNSILYGLPNNKLRKLQIIINNSARVISGISSFSRLRITPICIQLHILPIKARIVFKICLLTFKTLFTGQPAYLRNLLHFYQPATDIVLRHTNEPYRLLETRLCNAQFESRCFRFCAPKLFNMIPPGIRASDSISSFRKQLKTWIFQQCYNLSTNELNPSF